MHTVDQKDYGEANLGTRGMALFFSSHVCSSLCKALELTQFDLSQQELEKLKTRQWNACGATTKISDSILPPGKLNFTSQSSSNNLGSVDEVFDELKLSANSKEQWQQQMEEAGVLSDSGAADLGGVLFRNISNSSEFSRVSESECSELGESEDSEVITTVLHDHA